MAENKYLSFLHGSGIGGSQPRLVNEFLAADMDDCDPFSNVFGSANWTSDGMLSHESAQLYKLGN